MKKLLIGMIETILLSTGALKMSQPLKNTQYNDLTVRYYLGMTFPKYTISEKAKRLYLIILGFIKMEN